MYFLLPALMKGRCTFLLSAPVKGRCTFLFPAPMKGRCTFLFPAPMKGRCTFLSPDPVENQCPCCYLLNSLCSLLLPALLDGRCTFMFTAALEGCLMPSVPASLLLLKKKLEISKSARSHANRFHMLTFFCQNLCSLSMCLFFNKSQEKNAAISVFDFRPSSQVLVSYVTHKPMHFG